MRVLYLTTEIPYPLTSGFLRHYHFLKSLGQNHELWYLSLTRRPEVPAETYEALRPHVAHLEFFGAAKSPGQPALLRKLGKVPVVGKKYQKSLRLRWAARQMKAEVQRLLAEQDFDLIFFSGKDTFPAIEEIQGIPIAIDCCDATSLRVRGEMPFANLARKLWLRMRLVEVRRIERKIARKTPHLAFASIRDQEAMLDGGHDGIIIPQAVDLQRWTRRTHTPHENAIVFTGVMSYPPNHDAAVWLVDHILPLVKQSVPEAKLYIVGRDPLPELVAKTRGRSDVVLTGEPQDMRDYFELATVCCAPMRFASGMQFKVLEAMSMQVPMVTTPPAADGLHIDGHVPPLVVGQNEQELAAGVVRLLRDPAERARLAAAGRAYIEDHFVWAQSIEKLERLWYEAAGEQQDAEAHADEAACAH